MNFHVFTLDLEKAEEPEIKLPTAAGSSKKQESSRKTWTSALLTIPKPLTVWITTYCGKFLKRQEYQNTWPASWAICMQVKKQQLELDMNQHTGSKSGKEYVKALYCPPACLTYRQSTSVKCQAGWSTSQNQDCLEKYTNLRYAEDTTLMAESKEGLKRLDESERGEWKSWLKAQHSENEDHGIWSHHLMGNRWGKSGNSVNSVRLYFSGLQNHCRWWLQPWN